MRQQLLNLYELQKIDLSIREDQQRQSELPSNLRTAQAALTALTAQAEQVGQEKLAAEQEARQLSAMLDDEREKIRKWEARLGDLRNQREYQALHRETEGQRRANRDYEERLQASYKQQETLDEQLAALAGQIEAAKATCDEQSKSVSHDLQAMEARLADHQVRREALIPAIPKPLFRKYDMIRAKRQGIGLSLIRQGSCVSCHMRLPPQLYNVLQRADSIEQCPSCFRVMCWEAWLDPSEQQPAAEPPAAAQPAKKPKATRKAKARKEVDKAAAATDETVGADAPHG